MDWFDCILIGWFALNALIGIWYVGRNRGPITPSTAVVLTIIYGLLIAGVTVV